MSRTRRILVRLAVLAGLGLAGLALFVALRSPSNDREWNPDQARTPWAELKSDTAVVHDVRNFAWRERNDLVKSPVVTIEVDDMTAAVARLTEAGGQMLGEPQDVGGMGIAGYFRDPEGNVMGLWQSVGG